MKDEGTRSVSATRNCHCTELADCPGWARWDLAQGLLSQGISIAPASPDHALQAVCGDQWLGYVTSEESVLLEAEDKLAENHRHSSQSD